MTLKEMREQWTKLNQKLRDLAETLKDRDFTKEEKSDYERTAIQERELRRQIGIEKEQQERDAWGSAPAGDPRIGRGDFDGRSGQNVPGYRNVGGQDASVEQFVDPTSGREVCVLGPRASMRSVARNQPLPDGLSHDDILEGAFARTLRGIVTGRWEGAEVERRLMSGVSGSAGGYLIPLPLSATVIDAARNAARVMEAGARTVVMDNRTLTVAKLTSDPQANWRAEGAVIPSSGATIGALNLTAKTCAVIVPIAIELLEDMIDGGASLQRAVAASLGLALDYAALMGDGTGSNPAGIIAHADANQVEGGGVNFTFERALDGIGAIANANGNAKAAIFSPEVESYINRIKDGQGRYMPGPDAWERLSRLSTNQVPNTRDTDKSVMFIGDFSQMLIGMRSGITIQVLPSGTVDGSEAAERMIVYIRAYLRADVGLVRPNHFSVLDNIALGE